MYFNYNRIIPNESLDIYNEYNPNANLEWELSEDESKIPIYDLFILKYHVENKDSEFYETLSITHLGSKQRLTRISDIVVINFLQKDNKRLTAIASCAYDYNKSTYVLTVSLYLYLSFTSDKTVICDDFDTKYQKEQHQFVVPHFINENYAFFIAERYNKEYFIDTDPTYEDNDSLRYGLIIIDLKTKLSFYKSLLVLFRNGEYIHLNTIDYKVYDDLSNKTKFAYLEYNNRAIHSLEPCIAKERYENTRIVSKLKNISVYCDSGKLFVSCIADSMVNGVQEFIGLILIARIGVVRFQDNTKDMPVLQNIYLYKSKEDIDDIYGPICLTISLRSFSHIEGLIFGTHLEISKNEYEKEQYLISCAIKDICLDSAIIESNINLFEISLEDDGSLNDTLGFYIVPMSRTMQRYTSFRLHEFGTVH